MGASRADRDDLGLLLLSSVGRAFTAWSKRPTLHGKLPLAGTLKFEVPVYFCLGESVSVSAPLSAAATFTDCLFVPNAGSSTARERRGERREREREGERDRERERERGRGREGEEDGKIGRAHV